MGAYGGAAPPYETRRLRPDEWRELRELRLDSLRTDPLAFGSTLARELAYPESTWVMRVGAGATSRTTSTWVVTDAAGRLVGLTTVSEVEARLTIFGTWVAVPHRRKGLAGMLLDAALGWAEASAPLRPVWLEVNVRHPAAVRLYLSRGFRFTGVRHPLGHTAGEEVEEMVRNPPDNTRP